MEYLFVTLNVFLVTVVLLQWVFGFCNEVSVNIHVLQSLLDESQFVFEECVLFLEYLYLHLLLSPVELHL